MRWNGQTIEQEGAARLPGYQEPVVRTFDAPEALETRFHEVYARTALNRVPGGGRKLPFSWTVNPYRGCSHACTYCQGPDTPILMGDGSTLRIADLEPGMEIYGTVRDGRYRRYARTQVLDHWSTVKPAYRIELADGTELIASGDHRYLSDRGWKFVTGAMCGAGQRPCLTTNDSLVGTGRFAAPPFRGREYRRGYLCGLIRGDAFFTSFAVEAAGRNPDVATRFRLALADHEALDRAERYLAHFGVTGRRFAFSTATATRRAMHAIAADSRAAFETISDLISFEPGPTDEWRKGFLAGIFDAEGSCAAGTSALRVPNTDPTILAWTEACFRHFGFDVVLEDHGRDNGLKCIRLRGGLREQMRFFHLTGPAITRRRDIEGQALKSDADLRVVSIEPLGKAMRLYDITTGTGDFIANGVVSHNCFARPTHEFLDMDAGRDFEKEIIVKVNAPEVLRAELRRPSWRGEHIALGTNTDPYQWVEKRYRLTREIFEVLLEARNPCSILTKSPLLLRDLDVFGELAKVTEFSACLSIPTLDEKAWRATEPHTPHPRARVEAVAKLNAAGIPTGVLVAPVMPGINDAPGQVEAVVAACEEAGARRIGGQALFLRGSTKDVFMGFIKAKRPDLVPLYERLYARGAYLPRQEKERIEAPLVAATKRARRRQARAVERFERPAPPMTAPGTVARARSGREDAAPEDPRRGRELVRSGRQESLF